MREIDILLFHNLFTEDPPHSEGRSKRSGSGKEPMTPELSALLQSLDENGLIAGHLSSGRLWWQGVVRIPAFSESVATRRQLVKESRGDFRRMRIEYVTKHALMCATNPTLDSAPRSAEEQSF